MMNNTAYADQTNEAATLDAFTKSLEFSSTTFTKLDKVLQMSFICMLIDTCAFCNNCDSIDLANKVVDMVAVVNHEYGRFGE